jgi:hypothetical protein
MHRTKLEVALVLALSLALSAAGIASAAVSMDSSKLRAAVTTKAS